MFPYRLLFLGLSFFLIFRYTVVLLQLNMDELEGRQDAEFLLTHMCSVGFQEWTVVLATLLRRVEVSLYLFLAWLSVTSTNDSWLC